MHWFNAIASFEQYMILMERSQETIEAYQKDLGMFGCFLEKRYIYLPTLEQVKAEDIELHLLELKEKRNYEPASRNRHLYSLKSFFGYLSKKGWVDQNVALSVDPIRIQQKERVYLNENEIGQLVSAIDHSLVQIVVQTLYLTGLRISECLGLSLEDVDLSNRTIRVVHGKGNKERVVPISDRLFPLLQNYIEKERPTVTSSIFFATSKTGQLSSVYVNRHISGAVKKLGWKKEVSAHVLRHSFASQLVKKDVNLFQIQKLLGHSSLKVTSIYLHSDFDQLSQAVNAL